MHSIGALGKEETWKKREKINGIGEYPTPVS